MTCDPLSVERETCDELPVSLMTDNQIVDLVLGLIFV